MMNVSVGLGIAFLMIFGLAVLLICADGHYRSILKRCEKMEQADERIERLSVDRHLEALLAISDLKVEVEKLSEWADTQGEKSAREFLAAKIEARRDADKLLRPRNWRDTLKLVEELKQNAERQGR